MGGSKMCDVSEAAISEAYADVRDDKTDTDFVVLNYTDKSSLGVQSSGTTGIEGLLECLSEDQAQYAYLRVTTGDEESRRTKFVLISWCGPGVKALARAKMSVHKALSRRSSETTP